MSPRVSPTTLTRRSFRRLRETGRLPWTALSRVGRVSIAGVGASAVLAVALGVFIPRAAEHHALESRLEAMSSLVIVLERGDLIPPVGDHLTGADYARFDAVVRDALLGGENIRVKLWNLAGEVVYSDEGSLVGQRFPIGPYLASALNGTPSVDVSDLSAAENRLERGLGSQLLELYIPIRGDRGAVIGAFEVYQDFRHISSHLAAVRRVVWVSVGTGLSILLAFLVSLVAAAARAMARDERAARERAEDLSTLLQTSRALSAEPAIDRTGPEVLSALTARLGLRCGAVLLEGHEPRSAVAGRGERGVCPLALTAAREARDGGNEVDRSGRGDPALGHAGGGSPCTVLAIPIRAEPDLTGALVVCREAGRPFDPRERMLLSGVASQLGVAAEGAKLFAGLQRMTEARERLLRRLVSAQEEERRHLVGDLHDGLGQALTRILYGLRGSRSRLGPGEAEVAEELGRLESLVDEQSRNLRRYMAAIGPALLDDFGLERALEALARDQEAEANIPIEVSVSPLPEVDPATGITLLRAAQEAVINARKHAHARRLWIRLEQQDGVLVLEVGDDGRGAAALRDGIGLTYMKDRVASLGGRVDVSSRPGEGTTVVVRVPVETGYDGRDPGR